MLSPLLELRRYHLRPGRRDELVEVFQRELVHTQEEVGLRVLAQFEDRDVPDDFVWLRGFDTDDADARGAALHRFYDGPAWGEHAEAANATMLAWDDVLLLRPVAPDVRVPAGACVLTTCLVRRAPTAGELASVADAVPAVLVNADVPNTFPRLPVREGEHVVVWLEAGDTATAPPAPLRELLLGSPHVAHLEPAGAP